MLQSIIECPVYRPDHGDRIRILIEYAGSLRPILWMEFEKDGSLYLGPRKLRATELGQGRANRIDDQHVHISYNGIAPITDSDIIKKAKLSFHASGIISTPMGRHVRPPLRGLSNQELLCVAAFEHPKQFSAVAIDNVRKRDVCLRYPVDEDRPLWACLYVAPSKNAIPVVHSTATYQATLMFVYPATTALVDTTLQVALCHGPEGPWPPYTFLVFSANN